VFTGGKYWEEFPVMDRREERALNDVDRIPRAVEQLRHLLLAATKADLRAMSKRSASEPPEAR
jgi:hypothetical protein